MEVLKKYKSLLFFHFFLNIIFGVFISFSSFYHLPLHKAIDYFFYGIVFILIQFSVFGYLYLLGLNKYLFKIIFPPLFFVLSLAGFWGYSIDMSFTDGILHATFETKPDIVFDLISFPLLVFILIDVFVIVYLLHLYNKIEVPKYNHYLFLFALIGISSFYFLESFRNNIVKSRLPFNLFFELYSYSNKGGHTFKSPPIKIRHNTKDLKIVFVLGESVRADHLQINGYSRQTTPLLMKRRNVVSFKNAYTPLTYTGISVPQILSNRSFNAKDNTASYSLVDVLNNSNLKTCWLGNQTPEKSYETFIVNSKEKKMIDPFHTIYSFSKKYDSDLLPIFKKQFSKSDFILLHMIGSHWYYENRYRKKDAVFKPTIKSKYVPSNTSQEMINSYDNTILGLDQFLSDVIGFLEHKNEKILLIYVSDHGEFLGEKGKWLHAQKGPFRTSQNPAVLFWYSDKFKEEYSHKVKALKNQKNDVFPLTKIYHSVLDAYGLDNKMWIEKKSVFK
jgi:lipid A ethanolaminephosphotransferase